LQIVFAQRNFRCATIVSITQCVAVHCEALANTVEGYIVATVGDAAVGIVRNPMQIAT